MCVSLFSSSLHFHLGTQWSNPSASTEMSYQSLLDPSQPSFSRNFNWSSKLLSVGSPEFTYYKNQQPNRFLIAGAIVVGGFCERGRLIAVVPYIVVRLSPEINGFKKKNFKPKITQSCGPHSYTIRSLTWSGKRMVSCTS